MKIGVIAPSANPPKIFPTIFPIDSNICANPVDFVSCFTSTLSLVFVFICSSTICESTTLFTILLIAVDITALSKNDSAAFSLIYSVFSSIFRSPTSIS